MPSEFVSVIKPRAARAGDESEGVVSAGRAIPVLPVRDTVLFPHAVLPLTVGRESSILLIQSLGEEKTILVVAQRDARQDAPEGADLHHIGTRATVHKVVKMPNQSLFVFTEGNERVRLGEFSQIAPFMTAECETVEEIEPVASPETEALQRNVVSQFQQIVSSSPTLSDDLQTIAINIEEPGRLADFIASSLPFLTTTDKQELLETPDVSARLERINKHLAKEIEVQQLRNKIQTEVQDSVQSSQRDYYLREQLKAIQKELGDLDETQKDIAELKEKIEAAGMPEETKKDALKELGRLSRMNAMAADYSLTRNYIEWLTVLPWSKSSAGEVDILKAKEILDADHYGLKKVKDRILDYLSVRRLKPDMKGPILCFVGPPGVGKTTLGAKRGAGAGAEVCAHLAGRDARRGGAARSPADVHRRAAGAGDPESEAGGDQRPGVHAGRGGQAGAGLQGRSGERAAGGAGPGAEQYLSRQLSGPAVRPVEGAVHLYGEPARSGAGAAAGPDGDHRADGIHRGREGGDSDQVPDSAADKGERDRSGADRVSGGEHRAARAALHAGGGRAQAGAADWNDLPQAGAADRRGQAGEAGRSPTR